MRGRHQSPGYVLMRKEQRLERCLLGKMSRCPLKHLEGWSERQHKRDRAEVWRFVPKAGLLSPASIVLIQLTDLGHPPTQSSLLLRGTGLDDY